MTSKGFTLFEVLLAAGIVALISGGIFMAVATGIRTSTALAQHRLHSERLETLFSFFRKVFTNLPTSAELSLEIRESAELHLRHAPTAFPWTHKSAHVISLLSDGQKGSILAIKSYSDSLAEPERQRTLQEKTGWVQLLDGISRIKWRFFDLPSNSFREQWDFGRPQLVEMTLWQNEENPIITQFWIPPLQKLQTPR